MVELIDSKYQVVIADNLVNSKIGVLDKLEAITGVKPNFYQVGVTVESIVDRRPGDLATCYAVLG